MFIRIILATLVYGLLQVPCYAVEWNTTPTLQLAETYDNNVTLAQSGLEQSDYITQIRPGITLEGKSKNTELDLSYQLEDIIYKNNSEHNSIYHQATATSHSTYANERLFLDTRFNYTQTNISSSDPISLDNLAISQNRTDLFDYSIRPYMITPVGRLLEFQGYYTYSGYDYENNINQNDFTRQRVDLNLNNHNSYNRTIWDLNYSNNSIEYDNGAEIKFTDLNINLKYLITPKTYMKLVAGEENNNYQYSASDTPPEGGYWKAGLGWRPTKRTLLEMSGGERFYGSTKEFLFDHRTRFSTWNIRYVETLQTQNTDDNFISPGVTADVLSAISSIFTTEVYLSERLDVNIGWRTKKTTLRLRGYDEKRTYQLLKDTDRTRGAVLTWKWQFLSNTSASLTETYIKQNFRLSSRIDDVSDTTLEFERQIRPKLSGKIAFRTMNRSSTIDAFEYERNLVTLLIDMQF